MPFPMPRISRIVAFTAGRKAQRVKGNLLPNDKNGNAPPAFYLGHLFGQPVVEQLAEGIHRFE